MEKKKKLHELIAVASNVQGQSKKLVSDLKDTFHKKPHLFRTAITTYNPKAEGEEQKTEVHSAIQTSIAKELKWIGDKLSSTIDVGHQIDMGNTMAKAHVVLPDGKVLLENIPATSLLQLEKRLLEMQDFTMSIPTLDAAKGFAFDQQTNAYKAREVKKNKTQKTDIPITLYQATEHHPAQVQLLSRDVVTGELIEQEWSSLITTSEKTSILDKIEVLLRAVKSARARANEIDVNVSEFKIGETIVDHIFGDIIKNAKDINLGDVAKKAGIES